MHFKETEMNPGELILCITLIASLLVNILSFFKYQKTIVRHSLRVAYFAMFGGISAAVLLLTLYQFHHTFQYAYVFEHTTTSLPKIYLLSALWAGKEGAILTLAMISTWIGLLLWRQSRVPGPQNMTLGVFSLLNTLLILITYLSNPFKLLPIAPPEGMGLAPALQNPWMLLHPPLVFWGYSTMGALFSLSLTNDNGIVNSPIQLQKWTLMSSFFLGAGILTGSIWAEQALGWGKYWSWDPMENIALVSWLILVALAHSALRPKKGRRFDYALPFAIAVCGALLVRSGILQGVSLHTYGISEGTNWLSVLVFLMVFLLVLWVFSVMKNQFRLYTEVKYNRKGTLILVLLSFANLLIIATILQVMGLFRTPNIFNLLALLFAVSCIGILFIKRSRRLRPKRISIPASLAHIGFMLLFLGAILSIGFKPGVYLIWSGGLFILFGNLLLLFQKDISIK